MTTSRTLFLMRHGEASFSTQYADIDRPLTSAGEKEVVHTAKKILEIGHHPEHIVASPAVRTRETAKLVAKTWHLPIEHLKIVDALYHASLNNWLSILGALPDQWHHVLCIGHNPGISDIFQFLSKNDTLTFRTAHYERLEIKQAHWSTLDPDNA